MQNTRMNRLAAVQVEYTQTGQKGCWQFTTSDGVVALGSFTGTLLWCHQFVLKEDRAALVIL